MSELTRRRDPDAEQETWLIHYDDVRVGVIAERVGNPDSTPGWQWSCGFYPGSYLAERASGLAQSFDEARRAFGAAWRVFLANRTEADFEEYRRDRAFHALGSRPCGRKDSSCRHRLPTAARAASVACQSASPTWMRTFAPRIWRRHEVCRTPPLRRSRCCRPQAGRDREHNRADGQVTD